MAGHFSTIFSSTSSFGYANIDVPIQDLAATQTEDNLYIDPILSATTQRFLNDTHSKTYFTSMGVSAVPPPTQQRFASPMSSHELSSASGSAPSPGAETESFYEYPTTPPEVPSVFSPMPGQFDDFSSTHDAIIRFTGSGMMPSYGAWTDGGMNSLYNDNDMDYSQGMFFEPSYTSTQCDMSTNQNTVGSDFTRLASPAEDMPMIKEEIQASTSYSSPLKRELDHDSDSSSEESSLPPTPKRHSDSGSEDEHRPAKKTKLNNNNHPAPIIQQQRIPTQVWPPQPQQQQQQQPPKQQRLPKPSPRRINPLAPSSVSFKCPDCNRTDFPDRTDFDAHVKKQHTRPFTCVFHFAGCEATFAAKNEWKRHVITQHLLLDYWLCTEGVCAKTNNGGCRLPNGAIFNRKDLYTQHLKRMHMPAGAKKLCAGRANKGGVLTPGEKEEMAGWEGRLRELQERGKRERCKLPEVMRCPVKGCKVGEFRGPEAWDQRMEHVAKHLEGAALGREGQVRFGGEEDGSLVEWAKSREVGIIERGGRGGRWELRKVLERQGGGGNGQVRGGQGQKGRGVREEIVVSGRGEEEDAEGDVDAEGEEE